jgi:NADH pyrophosphatase NudC (nudix superfamily)
MAIYTKRPGHQAVHDPGPVQPLATDKQVAFALKLQDERGLILHTEDSLRVLLRRDISALIDGLLLLPKAPKPEAVTDGFYRLDGQYVKVQENLAGTRLYAKVWDGEGWDYESAKGVFSRLTPAMKLSAADASEFGKLYGHCVFCGRKLTDERSIEVGYGPTCAANNSLPWG